MEKHNIGTVRTRRLLPSDMRWSETFWQWGWCWNRQRDRSREQWGIQSCMSVFLTPSPQLHPDYLQHLWTRDVEILLLFAACVNRLMWRNFWLDSPEILWNTSGKWPNCFFKLEFCPFLLDWGLCQINIILHHIPSHLILFPVVTLLMVLCLFDSLNFRKNYSFRALSGSCGGVFMLSIFISSQCLRSVTCGMCFWAVHNFLSLLLPLSRLVLNMLQT